MVRGWWVALVWVALMALVVVVVMVD
jgi:hypothetical protein